MQAYATQKVKGRLDLAAIAGAAFGAEGAAPSGKGTCPPALPRPEGRKKTRRWANVIKLSPTPAAKGQISQVWSLTAGAYLR